MERQQFTVEQKKEIVGKVDKLKKEGQTTLDACKNAGVSDGNYYAWKRKKIVKGKAKVKAPRAVHRAKLLELAPQAVETSFGKVLLLFGTPDAISKVARDLV